VSCDLTRTNLHGYLDGELDAARAAEFERHLETCRECNAALSVGESLRSALQHSGLYERAPESLHQKIRADLKAANVAEIAPRTAPPAWRWLAVAAAILLVASVSWLALPSYFPGKSGPTEVTAAELIDAHVRSLQPGHLTDVTSTDQHTVKPWFDGKLDFVPPVKDYADEGFPLIGGRLDVLNGRSVAALVYGRRKHIINVFAWPTKEPDLPLHPSSAHQGYQWVHWRHQGMEYCAISDVAAPDIRELAQLFLQ
jgi:mycothiol system anti-sigma-R factor